MKFLLAAIFFLPYLQVYSQTITVSVNAAEGRKTVSPFLYGRNNNFSNVPGSPTPAADIKRYKEAGLRFARENGGNNATKYNWKTKLSSHPDWYNNVYDHDWDFANTTIETNMPSLGVMWSFQLIGKVASNKNHNFNDWGYNSSQWWTGVAQNLAGGGTVNPAGGADALVEGDPDLYLKTWPADSTTEILNHWFGKDGLDFDENIFRYWNMDNEPEIWEGTHDDVMPAQLSASDFMDRYFAVAKSAREKFPDIKLIGPVTANEWQWYRWANESLYIDGKYYSWLEYFLKRVADEEQASGMRLLDIVDIHWYPGEQSNADVVQLYRVLYDEDYAYPGANGVKTINGGWDNDANKEYIFKRIETWLTTYFGEDHGITLCMSEFGSNTSDVNANAVLYASMLGTFADHNVEIFTPWTWKPGMWEVLHLFSRYGKNTRVNSVSTQENTVSAYSTINENVDSLTMILVNRDLTISKKVNVNLSNFYVSSGNYAVKEIAALPTNETFVSHTNNGLNSRTVSISGNAFEITLPPLSITAVILKGSETEIVSATEDALLAGSLTVYPNHVADELTLDFVSERPLATSVYIYDLAGRPFIKRSWSNGGTAPLSIDMTHAAQGMYVVQVTNERFNVTKKVIVKR